MIAGKDIIIPLPADAVPLHAVLCAVARVWPAMIVEDAESGEAISHPQQHSHSGPELLIYRDQTAARCWQELGADESLAGTLIHAIFSPVELTLVVDSEPAAEVRSILAEIRLELSKQSLRPAM